MVTIETEVIELTNLLVSSDLSHDHIRILLLCPLLSQKLVQIYRLKGTYLGRVFDQLLQIFLSILLSLLAPGDKFLTSHSAGYRSLITLRVVKLRRFLSKLAENFRP